MGDDFLSDDDKALFRDAMRSVKPLGKQKAKVPRTHKSPKPTVRKTPAEIPAPLPVYLSSQYQQAISANAVLSYREPGLPIKRFKQFQKGLIPWQASLDLHGLRIDDAADALRNFISQQIQQGNRCLLIIHGKGGHLNDTSLMKSYVNHWLRQLPCVLGFHSSLPKDGGTGSVYLLLKKNSALGVSGEGK